MAENKHRTQQTATSTFGPDQKGDLLNSGENSDSSIKSNSTNFTKSSNDEYSALIQQLRTYRLVIGMLLILVAIPSIYCIVLLKNLPDEASKRASIEPETNENISEESIRAFRESLAAQDIAYQRQLKDLKALKQVKDEKVIELRKKFDDAYRRRAIIAMKGWARPFVKNAPDGVTLPPPADKHYPLVDVFARQMIFAHSVDGSSITEEREGRIWPAWNVWAILRVEATTDEYTKMGWATERACSFVHGRITDKQIKTLKSKVQDLFCIAHYYPKSFITPIEAALIRAEDVNSPYFESVEQYDELIDFTTLYQENILKRYDHRHLREMGYLE